MQKKETDNIEPKHFEKINELKVPQKFENFETFMDIYIKMLKTYALVPDTNALRAKTTEVYAQFNTFIENDPEYVKGMELLRKGGGEFDYKHPIFVTEGLCYLERILIPELFK